VQYWPNKEHGKYYVSVPESQVVEGRIGIRLVDEKQKKNYVVNQFELTREDLQVNCSPSSVIIIISSTYTQTGAFLASEDIRGNRPPCHVLTTPLHTDGLFAQMTVT